MLKINCEYKNHCGYCKDVTTCYTCFVSTEYIPEDKTVIKFEGIFPTNWTKTSIGCLAFTDSIIPKIPYGLVSHFENTVRLCLNNCQLENICKEDLRGLQRLHTLRLSNNNLEFIPGNLFKYTPALTRLNLSANKINFIGEELLENFTTFIEADFRNNKKINLYFDQNVSKFEEFKENFKLICRKMKNGDDKIKPEIIETEPENLPEKKFRNGICEDIFESLVNENFQDFTIKVDDAEFKVHKFIMMARSSTLAEMIKNNPDAKSLELKEISKKTFKEIINFMYTDQSPSEKVDMKEIFAVASKLKITKLREMAAQKLIDENDSRDAYDLLTLSHKHNHEELKRKAFKEMKKILPMVIEEMMNEPEKLKALFQAWRELEDGLKTSTRLFDSAAVQKI